MANRLRRAVVVCWTSAAPGAAACGDEGPAGAPARSVITRLNTPKFMNPQNICVMTMQAC
jgi:hypothetical protein